MKSAALEVLRFERWPLEALAPWSSSQKPERKRFHLRESLLQSLDGSQAAIFCRLIAHVEPSMFLRTSRSCAYAVIFS